MSAQYIDFKNGTKPANKTENATSAIKNTASTSSSSKLSNKRTYNGKTIDVNELIEYSKQFIGTPYVYGGTDLENGVDCSGFVMSVYKNFGVQLNRVSRDMYLQGTAVQRADLEPGDLLFFNTGGNSIISHVGMYIGNDEYIHSTNGAGDGVTISSMNDGYVKRTGRR